MITVQCANIIPVAEAFRLLRYYHHWKSLSAIILVARVIRLLSQFQKPFGYYVCYHHWKSLSAIILVQESFDYYVCYRTRRAFRLLYRN